jgi:hypothetical protein
MGIRSASTVAAALAITLVAGHAQAAVQLTGDITTDNAFFAFVSTSASTLGTLVASGDNWPVADALSSFTLTPGQNYYLQVEAINGPGDVAPSGEWGGVLGSFSLSGSGFTFANGAQTIDTDTTHWSGIYNDGVGGWGLTGPQQVQPWVTPTAGVVGEGDNSGSTYPWGGPVAGIDTGAQWIWANDALSYPGGQYGACLTCTIDLSTEITYTGPIQGQGGVPEISTWAMMLIGFGMVGVQLKRRGADLSA